MSTWVAEKRLFTVHLCFSQNFQTRNNKLYNLLNKGATTTKRRLSSNTRSESLCRFLMNLLQTLFPERKKFRLQSQTAIEGKKLTLICWIRNLALITAWFWSRFLWDHQREDTLDKNPLVSMKTLRVGRLCDRVSALAFALMCQSGSNTAQRESVVGRGRKLGWVVELGAGSVLGWKISWQKEWERVQRKSGDQQTEGCATNCQAQQKSDRIENGPCVSEEQSPQFLPCRYRRTGLVGQSVNTLPHINRIQFTSTLSSPRHFIFRLFVAERLWYGLLTFTFWQFSRITLSYRFVLDILPAARWFWRWLHPHCATHVSEWTASQNMSAFVILHEWRGSFFLSKTSEGQFGLKENDWQRFVWFLIPSHQETAFVSLCVVLMMLSDFLFANCWAPVHYNVTRWLGVWPTGTFPKVPHGVSWTYILGHPIAVSNNQIWDINKSSDLRRRDCMRAFSGQWLGQEDQPRCFLGVSLSSEPLHRGVGLQHRVSIVPLSLMESRGLDHLPCNQCTLLIANWFW